MRQIKFRAWDKKYKKFLNISHFPHSDFSEIYCLDEPSSYFRKDIVLMQYTGLTDKNGKEIYEGDIIRYNFGDTSLWQVHWYELFVKFELMDLKEKFCTEMGGGHEDYEVIGTIYENPELLEGDKNV